MVSLSNATSGSSSTMRMRLTIRLRLPNSTWPPRRNRVLPPERTNGLAVPQRPARNRRSPAQDARRSGPPPPRDAGPQRIAKLLARAGVASRRDIERMIAEGRVALNGEALTTPATLLENLTGVTVDGKPVRPP